MSLRTKPGRISPKALLLGLVLLASAGVGISLVKAVEPSTPSSPPTSPPIDPKEPMQGPKVAAPPPRSGAPGAADLEPRDEYYGVYVSGQKVGWMRMRMRVAPAVVFTTELRAQVAGMGQVTEISLNEERAYDDNGALQLINFTQKASTGQVEVVGHADRGVMHLEVRAGGATHKQDVEVNERLHDMLATYQLARSAKVGATATQLHFDASIQKVVKMQHKVLAVEKRSTAGVEILAVKVQSEYPELGVKEITWMDSAGKVLESAVGGVFVARLEPPEVAKRLDYHQDLLVSQVVRAPRLLVAPQNTANLTLRFSGFGENLPPSSPRQKVSADKGDSVTLALTKDAPPPRTPLPAKADAAAASPELREALSATAFIQSDAPELIAAAKKATAGAKDMFAASTKLVEFVYRHIHSEYVPAYSNALEAYETARGDCTEHSVLFVALARAVGIPARVAVGIAYWPPGDGFGWHAWAEVNIGGKWVAVDPTWNQPIADATHVKLADGDPAAQARIVMLLGQLKILEMRQS